MIKILIKIYIYFFFLGYDAVYICKVSVVSKDLAFYLFWIHA
jgi:hypothetical protein